MFCSLSVQDWGRSSSAVHRPPSTVHRPPSTVLFRALVPRFPWLTREPRRGQPPGEASQSVARRRGVPQCAKEVPLSRRHEHCPSPTGLYHHHSHHSHRCRYQRSATAAAAAAAAAATRSLSPLTMARRSLLAAVLMHSRYEPRAANQWSQRHRRRTVCQFGEARAAGKRRAGSDHGFCCCF